MEVAQWWDSYRSLLRLSHEMVSCARAKSWEQLAALDKSRQAVLEGLPDPLPPLSAVETDELARLIDEILLCNREISLHALPWLEKTSKLLAALGSSPQQKAR